MNIYTTKSSKRVARFLGATMMAALLLPVIAFSQSPQTVDLGVASTYVILAGQSVTNTGNTVLVSNVGISPGSTITGFPPGKTSGHIYLATSESAAAQVALTAAYVDAAGRSANAITPPADLASSRLVPGLYKGGALGNTGDLTFDGGGNANAVWILQCASTLITGVGSHMILAGGAQAKNIFWQVTSSATIGGGSTFYGTIIALQDISVGVGVTMVGRALARNGSAVFYGAVNGTNPDSLVANLPIFSTPSRNLTIDSLHVDSLRWKKITISNTGTADLILSSFTSTNPLFVSHLSATTVPQGGFVIDSLTYVPTAIGQDSTRLIFLNNAASSPDTIVVRSLDAVFATASRNLNIAATHIDSTLWTLIKLKNTGNDTLRFATVTSTNPIYASHLSALKIAPGDSITDSIKYMPLLMGADTARLIFTGNGMKAPDTIVVHGLGKTALLTMNSRNLNLGATHIDSTLWTLVTLTNTGNDTLRIASATNTNNVFTSHLSSLKIAPGGTFIDSIKFLPHTMGADSGKLVLNGNTKSSPDTIVVRGTGKAAILSAGSNSISVGSVQVGTPGWTVVSITNAGNDTLRITSTSSNNPVFSSQLSGAIIAPGASVVDMIEFLPTSTGGASGQLTFASNSITSPDMISVQGLGTAAPTSAILSVSSRNIDCGSVHVGTTGWTLITLTNSGTAPLQLTSSPSTNAFFASHLSGTVIAPGQWVTDSIEFTPTVVGSAYGKLIFIGNATSSPDTISVSGIGATAVTSRGAILSTGSRDVDCGTVDIGKHTWTLLTLYNTGTDSLHMSSVSLTNAVFDSHISDSVIAPGESIVVLIIFLPTKIGLESGTLTILSNATTSPDTIHVHGNGTIAVGVNDGMAPALFALGELYPNPFSDETTLQVRLQDGEQLLHAAMYDMLGHELQNWTSRIGGTGALSLHLGFYPNGQYMIRLQSSSRMQIIPMMIVK